MTLVLGSQDVLTAFDGVRHDTILEAYSEMGAAPQQVLSLARSISNCKVNLRIPGVAVAEEIPMSKALRTGGRQEPRIFVKMFEKALAFLVPMWTDMQLGFTLRTAGEKITHLLWVDNRYLMADDLEQYKIMATSLTEYLWSIYKWEWKPSSLEIMCVGLGDQGTALIVPTSYGELKYAIVDSMVQLGGLLTKTRANLNLLEHRLAAGEKCYLKYRKPLRGRHPVQLRLKAYEASVRGSALYLASTWYINKQLLLAARSWERRMLEKIFRFKRRADDTKQAYNERLRKKLDEWLKRFNIKPIVTVILERVHAGVWRETRAVPILRKIREDRNAMDWEALQGISSAKRHKEGAPVHRRPGPQLNFDSVFCKATGVEWRQGVEACAERGTKAAKTKLLLLLLLLASLLTHTFHIHFQLPNVPNDLTLQDWPIFTMLYDLFPQHYVCGSSFLHP